MLMAGSRAERCKPFLGLDSDGKGVKPEPTCDRTFGHLDVADFLVRSAGGARPGPDPDPDPDRGDPLLCFQRTDRDSGKRQREERLALIRFRSNEDVRQAFRRARPENHFWLRYLDHGRQYQGSSRRQDGSFTRGRFGTSARELLRHDPFYSVNGAAY